MHRFVLGLRKGDPRKVDHKNRNRLDNRRENLRVVTSAENAQNLERNYGRSRHRGVAWHKVTKKWRAVVRLDGRQHHLGYFDDEDEAGAVASAFRAQHMPFSSDAEGLACR
jgi:hypothetical protein